jgi:hypothetical protein
MTTPQIDLALRQNISSTVGLHTNLICGNKRAPTNALTVIYVPIILLAVMVPTNNSLGGYLLGVSVWFPAMHYRCCHPQYVVIPEEYGLEFVVAWLM